MLFEEVYIIKMVLNDSLTRLVISIVFKVWQRLDFYVEAEQRLVFFMLAGKSLVFCQLGGLC